MNTLKTIERGGPSIAIRHFLRDDRGATAIEYGLIAVATGLALAAVMPAIKTNLITTYTAVGDNLN
jgi:pilus assembly protein Flp/PilA